MGYVSSVLTPAVSQALKANPTVTEDEVIGRYTRVTAPFLVNGRIPANRLGQVHKVVQDELLPWVEQLHATRSTEQQAKAKTVADAAKKTADAKRTVARVLAPQGENASGKGTPAKSTKFGSAKEWLNTVLPSPSED